VTGLATNRVTKSKKTQPNEVKTGGLSRTLHWLLPLVGVFFLLYIFVSLFTDRTGTVGFFLADQLRYSFGSTAVVPLLSLLYLCFGILLAKKIPWRTGRAIGLLLLNGLISLSFTLGYMMNLQDISMESVFRKAGGWLGSALIQIIHPILGSVGTILFLVLLAFISLCLISQKPPVFFIGKTSQSLQSSWRSTLRNFHNWQTNRQSLASKRQEEIKRAEAAPVTNANAPVQTFNQSEQLVANTESNRKDKPLSAILIAADQAAKSLREADTSPQAGVSKSNSLDTVHKMETEQKISHLTPDDELVYQPNAYISAEIDGGVDPELLSLGSVVTDSPFVTMEDRTGLPYILQADDVEPMETVLPRIKQNRYQKPPLDILTLGKPMEANRIAELDLKTEQLEQTLALFGVKAKVVHVSCGPTITRYELQLAPGIRVNKVANLSDDIALSLAATGVRIEAPIPGKSAIGIEVPNLEVAVVTLRDVLSSQEFADADKGVIVALGKDIAGRTIITDLSKMPHLLIAGATGSGKSVCMNCMITSLLYRFSPEQIKLIMIDPKVVEMATYNGIPHLLAPVVTDPKKAAGVLKSVTREMDRRYELFAAFSVKNIGQFNEKVLKDEHREPLPYWIIFIDELADLMIVARDEVEESIIRIAQLARAAGIHLVIGTQRPSADIITGSIKANIPSRIAFAVSSGIDSRIILDMNGAEKLLGRGDMLFQPMGIPKPMRIQGAYISETEVEAVVSHVKMQGAPIFNDAILTPEEISDEDEDTSEMDDLFMQAARIVIESGQGSVSYLQRRLKVGHSRAGRIMDQLEEVGVVGPAQGSKPREVLLSKEQLENKFGN
jgi:DNA segregation ATPase FtsK/SpoIIIE-like protein